MKTFQTNKGIFKKLRVIMFSIKCDPKNEEMDPSVAE